MCDGSCRWCGLCGVDNPIVIYCVIRKCFMCHECAKSECIGFAPDHNHCDLVHC